MFNTDDGNKGLPTFSDVAYAEWDKRVFGNVFIRFTKNSIGYIGCRVCIIILEPPMCMHSLHYKNMITNRHNIDEMSLA